MRDLNEKLDDYQERLVKIESIMGFVKAGFAFVLSIASYFLYKIIDITGSK
jgi:hypothetical protein